MERKLNYFGHIVRRSEGVEKQILQGAVEGKRGRGRPPISWTRGVDVFCGYLVVWKPQDNHKIKQARIYGGGG